MKALSYLGLAVVIASCGSQTSPQLADDRQAVEQAAQADSTASGVSGTTTEASAEIGETDAPVDLDSCNELRAISGKAFYDASRSNPRCDTDADCERKIEFSSKVCLGNRCYAELGSSSFQAAIEHVFEAPELVAACEAQRAGNCFRIVPSCPWITDTPSYVCVEGECSAVDFVEPN